MTCYTGTVPSAWAEDGAFPVLQVFQVTGSALEGTLPASWGSNGSFGSITDLELNSLSGTLPAEWGSPTAFQSLVALSLSHCNITGIVMLQLWSSLMLTTECVGNIVLDSGL